MGTQSCGHGTQSCIGSLAVCGVDKTAVTALGVDDLPAVFGLHACAEADVPLALDLADAMWVVHGVLRLEQVKTLVYWPFGPVG